MKKKVFLAILAIITLIITFDIIGSATNAVSEQRAAKETFLKWLHELEPETITDWGGLDKRKDDKFYLDVNDEQKKELCLLLKSITSDEVTLGPGPTDRYSLSLWIYVFEKFSWGFLFDGEVVYLHEMPDELEEITGWWYWEIRNEELTEFFLGLLEK